MTIAATMRDEGKAHCYRRGPEGQPCRPLGCPHLTSPIATGEGQICVPAPSCGGEGPGRCVSYTLRHEAREAAMLTAEENELLTRVGPGTPGGELLRRYWHPVGFLPDLTDDTSTRHVRILGEA